MHTRRPALDDYAYIPPCSHSTEKPHPEHETMNNTVKYTDFKGRAHRHNCIRHAQSDQYVHTRMHKLQGAVHEDIGLLSTHVYTVSSSLLHTRAISHRYAIVGRQSKDPGISGCSDLSTGSSLSFLSSSFITEECSSFSSSNEDT
jgi:hypothetical protein